MGSFLIALVLSGSLILLVHGQDTCLATPPSYSMAAFRRANQENPNQYFVVGGLFDIHNKGNNAYECSADMSDTGFINMLAFFWGINHFFNTLLASRSVSVGAVAFDNCMRSEQTISNVFDYAKCRIGIEGLIKENLVAYVGPYTNEDSLRSGALAADLGITVFSPMAETNDLTFATQRSLLEMRPSFLYDLKAIAAFLNRVNASYVILLYSSKDPFWKDSYDELSQLIRNSGTSVVPCIQYTADLDTTTVDSVTEELNSRASVKYIVPLVNRTTLESLLSKMYARSQSQFILILTSRIGRDLPLLLPRSSVANNTIVIDSEVPADYQQIVSNFNNFLVNVTTNNSVPGLNEGFGNSWIAEYLAKKQSLLSLYSNMVASPLRLSVYRTLLSVNAIIRGMDAVLSSCGSASNYQFCDQFRNQGSKTDDLYLKLKETLGIHMTNSGELKYSSIMYNYYIFISNNLGTIFQQVGTLTVGNTGEINVTINDLKNGGYGYAFSDPACPTPGQSKCCEVLTTTAPITTAISVSTSGPPTQTTPSRYSEVLYPSGQAITGAFGYNDRPNDQYGTRFDIGQKWIIALGVLAGLGILCVIVFEIYILYKLLGAPGSRWRTMWLGQLLLFGIFLCYLVLFAYLPVPTKATCGITRFGVGVSYAFCFAVLLVKLMVILTSKPSEVLLPGDVDTPNYLKVSYQFLMFIFALGVQIVIDVQWLITVPPEAVLVTSNNGQRVWICNHYTWEAGAAMDNMPAFVRTEFENHLMSLIYIMVMILITTILALKSHGIITNHRESIFVGIAAGFSIPIWLAWGLVGGLNKNHDYAQEFGDACIAFGLLITATLILFSMFLPKVRHLVNVGVEGIYLEDDQTSVFGNSVILAPPSFKSKGSGSVIFVNSPGIYSEPVVINGDPMATHLKHPGSVYSVPGGTYLKNPESLYGGSTRVLRVTDDLRGYHPQKRAQSELAFGAKRPQSHKGTLPRSKSQSNLGAL